MKHSRISSCGWTFPESDSDDDMVTAMRKPIASFASFAKDALVETREPKKDGRYGSIEFPDYVVMQVQQMHKYGVNKKKICETVGQFYAKGKFRTLNYRSLNRVLSLKSTETL